MDGVPWALRIIMPHPNDVGAFRRTPLHEVLAIRPSSGKGAFYEVRGSGASRMCSARLTRSGLARRKPLDDAPLRAL